MKKIVFTLLGAFLIGSCSGDSEDDLKEDAPEVEVPVGEVPVNESLTFERDIQPVISDRCLKCHNMPTNFGAPASSVFVSFNQVSTRADQIFARINNGSMPPASEGTLDPAFVEIFEKWIEDGKLEK